MSCAQFNPVGELETAKGTLHFKYLRSETIGTDLKIMFMDPVPQGGIGYVQYRRFKSDDDWSTMPMEPGAFEFSLRERVEAVQGTGAELPSERAGGSLLRLWGVVVGLSPPTTPQITLNCVSPNIG